MGDGGLQFLRVGKALKQDAHHAFPDIVDNFAGDAQRFKIPYRIAGGEIAGQSDLFQLEGALQGKSGRMSSGIFEWIVHDGQVTHRRFIEGGQITGFPNQRVR